MKCEQMESVAQAHSPHNASHCCSSTYSSDGSDRNARQEIAFDGFVVFSVVHSLRWSTIFTLRLSAATINLNRTSVREVENINEMRLTCQKMRAANMPMQFYKALDAVWRYFWQLWNQQIAFHVCRKMPEFKNSSNRRCQAGHWSYKYEHDGDPATAANKHNFIY